MRTVYFVWKVGHRGEGRGNNVKLFTFPMMGRQLILGEGRSRQLWIVRTWLPAGTFATHSFVKNSEEATRTKASSRHSKLSIIWDFVYGRGMWWMVCPSWQLDTSPLHYDWPSRSMTPISSETCHPIRFPRPFHHLLPFKLHFISLITIYSSPSSRPPDASHLSSIFCPKGNCPVFHFYINIICLVSTYKQP